MARQFPDVGPKDPFYSHRRAAIMEDAHWLLAQGLTVGSVAARVGVKEDTLEKMLERERSTTSNPG